MWPRCSECDRLVGKHRTRCVICEKLLCRWCGRYSFCSLHYEELDEEGKGKVFATYAGFIITVVLTCVLLFIFLNTIPYNEFFNEKLIIGSMIGFLPLMVIFYVVYRAILRRIHFKHST